MKIPIMGFELLNSDYFEYSETAIYVLKYFSLLNRY